MKIEYRELNKQDIDMIAPLWEKLREHHRVRSEHFTDHFTGITWAKRKALLIEKSASGYLQVNTVTDVDTGKIAGYCVSTISGSGQGEIESIFVESKYRKTGIGDGLMQRALAWMNELHTNQKILGVGVGNEEVLTFYKRYNFFPRTIILEQVETISSEKTSSKR
jgi:ribosomal protein S18 acetylase RimI-like enzyme